MVNRNHRVSLIFKESIKGISKPGELFTNCLLLSSYTLCLETQYSEIFILQIGQTILGFKTDRESNLPENMFLMSYKMDILL